MLLALRIQQFAIMEDVRADFFGGESVVTGETGSGKSIFVDALDFICAAKSRQDIRRNEEPASVEAIFSIEGIEQVKELCLDLGIEIEDDSLIIRRELNDRSSRQWVNDKSVTLAALKKITELIMDIHSQNAQSLLKNPSSYLPLLDDFIGEESKGIKKSLRELISQGREIKEAVKRLDLSPEEVERKRDLLEFQKDEIEEGDLENLDEEALDIEYKELSSALERAEISSLVLDALAGERRSIKSDISTIAGKIDRLYILDDKIADLNDLIWQIDIDLDSFISDLDNYRDRIIVDSNRIREIDEKFQLLQKLKRKYGSSKKEILAFYRDLINQIKDLDDIEEKRNKYRRKAKEIYIKLKAGADSLHELRKSAAEKLVNRVKLEMKDLAIKNISFDIPFYKNEKISYEGYDEIDFQISTNPGEPMMSLAKVASGGEMSRFMLALKIIAADITAMPTIVFDEIDTGISGRTAQLVAQKLSDLSEKHQIIVISHLPQIAALANRHYLVKKESHDNVTKSNIILLDNDGRLDELARLIGGVTITDITRNSAKQMLEQAKEWREIERSIS